MGSSGGGLEERLCRRDVADSYGQLTRIGDWALFYLLKWFEMTYGDERIRYSNGSFSCRVHVAGV